MQDSFFAPARKRKRTANSNKLKTTDKPTTKRKTDEEIESAEEEEDDNENLDGVTSDEESSEDEEDVQETAAEKRVRLAKAYLEKVQKGIEEELGEGFDAAELDRDLIAERLKKDDEELAGRLHRRIADTFNFEAVDESKIKTRRGHQLAVTAVALADNGTVLYTASKDGSIIKWNPTTLEKLHTFPGGRKGVQNFTGHTDHVLCLAISSDGEYLASGGRDKLINVWSVKENSHVCVFRQHRDAIAGLVFRKNSHQLYSASWDRTVKLWNVDERAYMETLFGHQDQIADIDTLGRERCVTVGGRDRTARMWKIPEESQLVYRGGIPSKEKDENGKPFFAEGSLDCIAQVDETLFITGGDSGVISMWDIGRKKPIYSHPQAHGVETTRTSSDIEIKTPFYITALAALQYSDLFVSGSWDGFVRLWKISADNKSFSLVGQIPVDGVVNSIQIKTMLSSNRTLLVVGVGQELRTGRWLRLKHTKNCTKIIELPLSSLQQQ